MLLATGAGASAESWLQYPDRRRGSSANRPQYRRQAVGQRAQPNLTCIR
jgi:hypothetical protein